MVAISPGPRTPKAEVCLRGGIRSAAQGSHQSSRPARRGRPRWEEAGRARESRKARGSHAGKALGVEMPKRSEFEGYFCCRRNQKSGSEGIGETSVACGMSKLHCSKWRSGAEVPTASGSAVPHRRAPGTSPARAEGPAPPPAPPWCG